MSINPLIGVRIKIDRAKKHLADLKAEIEAYRARDACSVVKEIDPQSQDEIYRFRMREPIPPAWGAIVGDCIHNLRASLDLLANAIVKASGGTPTDNTQFPVSRAAQFVDGDISACLAGASPEAKTLVKQLKPYKGADSPIWRLHRLDIADKHKLLVLVAMRHSAVRVIFNPAAIFAGMLPPGKSMPTFDKELSIDINPADRQFPLKDGAILMVGKKPTPGTENHTDHKFIIDIAFGEGQIVDGEPVVPALQQLVDFTERVIDIFSRHLFK